jgi:hypothetical protein
MPLHSPLIPWIFAAALTAAVACLLASWFLQRNRALVTAAGGFLTVAAALFLLAIFPELVDSRYRAFRSLYRKIEPGMNRADVDSLVRKYYPDNGPRTTPGISQQHQELHFHMHPENLPEPNSELFTLVLQSDGRVAGKTYSAD